MPSVLNNPLTQDEKDQIDRNMPVLGKNPPGIDMGSVMDRMADDIEAKYTSTTDLEANYSDDTELAANYEPIKVLLADPGDGNAITVPDGGDHLVQLVSAGVETRTLDAPVRVGQKLTLYCLAHVGNIVVTAAADIDHLGNNTITFAAARHVIHLQAVLAGGPFTPTWQRLGAGVGVVLA